MYGLDTHGQNPTCTSSLHQHQLRSSDLAASPASRQDIKPTLHQNSVIEKLTWHTVQDGRFGGLRFFARGPLAALCLGGKEPPCKIRKGSKGPRCKKN
uniref:Uncharacterized protein n=1 Tax=Oryza rufipogon TaxID=4529 RepID=A0A0E0QBQ9_ORYRU